MGSPLILTDPLSIVPKHLFILIMPVNILIEININSSGPSSSRANHMLTRSLFILIALIFILVGSHSHTH
jgi:hypothetical protein